MNVKNPEGNHDVFALWQPDSSPSIELLYEKCPPHPDGYAQHTAREVLVWCDRCDCDSLLRLKSDEENRRLLQYGFFWSDGGTSVVKLVEDILTDTVATPAFFLFSYPNKKSLLEKCWGTLYWEKIRPDVSPEDRHKEPGEWRSSPEIHKARMLRRYDRLAGRQAFIELFTVYVDDVLSKLREYDQRVPLDTENRPALS